MGEFAFRGRTYHNPAELAHGQLGGTWKIPILWRLKDRTLRYNELKKDIPGITYKMLAAQLRELEDDGYLVRTVYPEVPPRVEYQLSEKGQRVVPLIEAIRSWGLELMQEAGLTGH